MLELQFGLGRDTHQQVVMQVVARGTMLRYCDEKHALLDWLPVVEASMQFAINKRGPSLDLVSTSNVVHVAIKIGSDMPHEVFVDEDWY